MGTKQRNKLQRRDLAQRLNIGKKEENSLCLLVFTQFYCILKWVCSQHNAQSLGWLQGTSSLDWIQWASACKVHKNLSRLHNGSDHFLTCSCVLPGAQRFDARRELAGDIFPLDFSKKLCYYAVTVKMHWTLQISTPKLRSNQHGNTNHSITFLLDQAILGKKYIIRLIKTSLLNSRTCWVSHFSVFKFLH